MSTPAGDDLVGNATIRVDGDTDPATRALAQFSRDAQGRLRDLSGRFVSESNLINRSLTNAAGGGDRFGFSLRGIASAAGTAAGILGRVGASIGAIGAAAGTAAPLLAGIVTTLESIAPAGAVAVTGMLAVQQASAAIKLGMVGIEDAISAALDPSKAAEFSTALEKLAPNARSFATAIRDAQPAFQSLQQGVQNRLFAGFADELQRLSTAVLPVVRTNLNQTATTLNQMALGAAGAARELGTSGTLGTAMAGANQGLSNLRKIPGQVVTALGQLAAAGAPAFDQLTSAAAGVATSISERLSTAFESGALESAVNTAVDVLKDLGDVGRNVFEILGNVMAPVQAAGGGLIGILKQITGALADATGTQGFQDAIGALAQVMGTLARTAGPLLGQALAAIGPIFTTLGPPIERLITSLGSALSPIIGALGPVLTAAAGAVGTLVDAVSPLLPVIGNLISSLLPPLVPLLQAISSVFAQAGPVVQLLGQALATALAPILAQLPAIVTPLANVLTMLAQAVFPVLAQTVVALAPSLASIGASFGQLLAAVAPLLTILGQLVGQALMALLPLLQPIISLITQLAAVFAGQLGNAINNVIVPAIRLITALLRGDFTGAWNAVKALIIGVAQFVVTTIANMGRAIGAILGAIVSVVRQLPGRLFAALAALGGGLARIAQTAWNRFKAAAVSLGSATVSFVRSIPGRIRGALSALGGILASIGRTALTRFLSAIRSGASNAVSFVRGIPGRLKSALGRLGGLLVSAGKDLILGMISGIKRAAGALVSAAKGVIGDAIDGAKSLLGISSPSKVFAGIGQDTGRGFIEGLTGIQSRVEAAVSDVSKAVPKAFQAPNLAMAGVPSLPGREISALLGVGTTPTNTSAAALATVNITLHLTNQGVIGSRMETENWLARALDSLDRTGRLPKSLRRA